MNIIVRPETKADVKAVDRVVGSAFKSPAVAWMVRQLRESPNYIPELSLVAERDGEIVGFVMLSYAQLADGPTTRQVINLSPLAVAPDAQKHGVGSSLMQEAIARAEKIGEPAIMLEGNPGYYSRFGFEDSRKYGVHFEDGGLVRPLSKYSPEFKGTIHYPPVFAEMQSRRERERQKEKKIAK
jgi:putative acetyltransferase